MSTLATSDASYRELPAVPRFREVCRRAHAKEKSKMQAVVADYKRKISQNKASSTDGGPEQAGAPTRGPPIGGVLMGQKGQEMLKERQEHNETGSSGAPPGRLV
jgi:hypothetical protein